MNENIFKESVWVNRGSGTHRESRGIAKKDPITCDDVDGIINLLDHYFPEKMSKRRTAGWVSLCPNWNIAYVAGKPLHITPFEKESQLRFAASNWQGTSLLSAKADKILKETADKQAAEAERLRLEKEAKAKRDISAALANEKFRQESEKAFQQRKSQITYIPDECPVCHKPVYNSNEPPVQKCDRDAAGNIVGGCIRGHQSCLKPYNTRSALQGLLRSVDPTLIYRDPKKMVVRRN